MIIVVQEIIVSNQTTAYKSIPADCSQPGNPDDVGIHDRIKQIMDKSQVQSVWLPIARKNHTNWTWMDGTIYG